MISYPQIDGKDIPPIGKNKISRIQSNFSKIPRDDRRISTIAIISRTNII
jgi:hypothetical protein